MTSVNFNVLSPEHVFELLKTFYNGYNSSCSVTEYFVCGLDSLRLKKAIGLLFWVLTASSCLVDASVYIIYLKQLPVNRVC